MFAQSCHSPLKDNIMFHRSHSNSTNFFVAIHKIIHSLCGAIKLTWILNVIIRDFSYKWLEKRKNHNNCWNSDKQWIMIKLLYWKCIKLSEDKVLSMFIIHFEYNKIFRQTNYQRQTRISAQSICESFNKKKIAYSALIVYFKNLRDLECLS